MNREQSILHYQHQLEQIKADNLWKRERLITSPQGNHIVSEGKEVLNFCANNYLGLSSHPKLIEAAHRALEEHGYGLSSVRFICGTQDLHKTLEKSIAQWLETEDTILYSSCFDANGGVFETLLGPEDAVISDELNHASIIDGIRLCKATRYRYLNCNMADLEEKLQEAELAKARIKLVVTDGVFSMDGIIAPVDDIVALAKRYGALVMVDDSHASGFLGPDGRGTPSLKGVSQDVDLITSTMGKALGGASGGFVTGRQPIIDLLRQRSRPYLFSNSLAPMIAGATLAALQLIKSEPERRSRLEKMTQLFTERMVQAGFTIPARKELHPIVPIMIGDAGKAAALAEALLKRNIYVIAFSYPVVPQGKARIRVQISASHSESDVHTAIDAFVQVGREMGLIQAN